MSCRVLDEPVVKSARDVEEGDVGRRRQKEGSWWLCEGQYLRIAVAHEPQHFRFFFAKSVLWL